MNRVTASAPAAASAPAKATAKPALQAPDFGGVTSQRVEVTASGNTLQAAVENAVRLAVEQVNGVQLAARSVRFDAGASVRSGGDQTDVSSKAYADFVASATAGAVTDFKVLSQQQTRVPVSSDRERRTSSSGPSWSRGDVDARSDAAVQADASYEAAYAEGYSGARARADAKGAENVAGHVSGHSNESVRGHWDQQQGATSSDYQREHTEYATAWEVRISANVAVYRESAAAKRTRIVVAQPQVKSQTYRVGDAQVPASDIAGAIQTELSDALTQTHRFTVLDRNADPEIDAEVQRIRSGNTVAADSARLGQQLATDLIVIPTIHEFEYDRHERALHLADRTLAWYSGGADVGFRVVNAVTGQVVMAKSFHYTFPSTSPTTLGVSVDGNELTTQMMGAIGHDIITSILRSTYPVLVLQVQGQDVVLNQGGDAIKAGAAYQAVFLGKAMVDPQSGESLGPIETPCCTIFVDRVTPKLAYGHVADGAARIPSPFTPGSIELGDPVAAAPVPAKAEQVTRARQVAARKPPRKVDSSGSADANW